MTVAAGSWAPEGCISRVPRSNLACGNMKDGTVASLQYNLFKPWSHSQAVNVYVPMHANCGKAV